MSLLDLPPQATAASDALKRLFRRHAAGVAVVTASHAGHPVGLLVSSLSSLASTPPLLTFNVARTASSWPVLADATHLGVHLLEEGQLELADRFARSGSDRFAPPTVWGEGPFGVPLLQGVAARALTVVEQRIPVADHVIVVARVLETEISPGTAPLLHHDGRYHRPVPHTAPPSRRSPA